MTVAILLLTFSSILEKGSFVQRINSPGTLRHNEHQEYKVPNIVHYIWYNAESVDFPFHRALSVLSAVKHIKPHAVYFHTANPPKGKYFEMLTNISIFKVKPVN